MQAAMAVSSPDSRTLLRILSHTPDSTRLATYRCHGMSVRLGGSGELGPHSANGPHAVLGGARHWHELDERPGGVVEAGVYDERASERREEHRHDLGVVYVLDHLFDVEEEVASNVSLNCLGGSAVPQLSNGFDERGQYSVPVSHDAEGGGLEDVGVLVAVDGDDVLEAEQPAMCWLAPDMRW